MSDDDGLEALPSSLPDPPAEWPHVEAVDPDPPQRHPLLWLAAALLAVMVIATVGVAVAHLVRG